MRGPITSEQVFRSVEQRFVSCGVISSDDSIFLDIDQFAQPTFVVLEPGGASAFKASLYNPSASGPTPLHPWTEGIEAVLKRLSTAGVQRCIRIAYVEPTGSALKITLEFDILNKALRPMRRVENFFYQDGRLRGPDLTNLRERVDATIHGLACPFMTMSQPAYRWVMAQRHGGRWLREMMKFLETANDMQLEGTINGPTISDSFYRIYCRDGRLGGDIDLAPGIVWRDQDHLISIDASAMPLGENLIEHLAGRSLRTVVDAAIFEGVTIDEATLDPSFFEPQLMLKINPLIVNIDAEFQPYWLQGKPFSGHLK